MSATNSTLSEYGQITTVIDHYLAGAMSGRGAGMKPAFHEDATICGYVRDGLFAGPIEQLFDWNDENGPAVDLEARIASIDLAGSLATVRVPSAAPIPQRGSSGRA